MKKNLILLMMACTVVLSVQAQETKSVKIYNLIILDESGSMASLKRSTISGFNEVVQSIQSASKQFPEQQHYISLVTFNGDGIKTVYDQESVSKLKEIDGDKYQPMSNTPLYDAMGNSFLKLRKTTDKDKNCKVLVTILTDGEENSSKEFKGQDIKKLVEELKEKGWVFTYIGANHDVEAFAKSISIENVLEYKANASDMKAMFETENTARKEYYNSVRNKTDGKANGDYYKKKK